LSLFEFFAYHCFVKNHITKEIIFLGKVIDGVYIFPHLKRTVAPFVHIQASINIAYSNTIVNNYDIWHKCLGHTSKHGVHYVLRAKTIEFCDSCAKAKSHQLLFSPSLTFYTTPFQLIFVDIWGPSHTSFTNGSLYYIVFLDVFSMFTWLYLINLRFLVFFFLQIKLLAENQTGFTIKSLQSDNAKEFIFLTKMLCNIGIAHHRLTCPHTPKKWFHRKKTLSYR